MIGHPKFKLGQSVQFKLQNLELKKGIVHVVDAYGTFGQNKEVSYDILVPEDNTLYKHIEEPYVQAVSEKLN